MALGSGWSGWFDAGALPPTVSLVHHPLYPWEVNLGFTIDPQGVETRIINDLVDFDGMRVLEVGCGDGRMTWRFAEKASSVIALDVNEEKIEAARRATPEHLQSKVRFEVTDITRTNLPGDSFDVAVLSYSL